MVETQNSLVPVEAIAQCILVLRGKRVILDSDLARLYGVTTARLNQQVRRNLQRFPQDFAFQLSKDDFDNLMLHFATSSSGHGGRRKLPFAFTEHGALMAATVLNSPLAVQVSVFVVRAFVQLRELLSTHVELSYKLDELEDRVDAHDEQIADLIEAIRQLLAPSEPPPPRRISFRLREDQLPYIVTPRNQESKQ
jgi:hypothetical protein